LGTSKKPEYSRGQPPDFITLRELVSGVKDSVSIRRLCETVPVLQ